MKIFLDTNIFLDVLLKRENYSYSLEILNSCLNGVFEGIVVDITLLNIDYIAKKQSNNIKEFLEIINENFIVVGANNKTFKEAFKIDNLDLEDNIQYICAKNSKCNTIITNDKLFFKEKIETFSAIEFCSHYLNYKTSY